MAKSAKLIRRRKPVSFKFSWPSFAWLPLAALVLGSFGLGAASVVSASHLVGEFVVERVEVEGDLVHLRPGEVQSRVEALLLKRSAKGDLRSIRQVLDAQPWVAQARVRRVWPDTLQIELVEQRPVAQWNEREFLGLNGELFEPIEPPLVALPSLHGPVDSEAKVYQQFLTWQTELADTGLELNRLDWSVGAGWTLGFDSGLELRLGRDDIESRLARFITVWPSRLAVLPNLERVDMRYGHSLSIEVTEEENG